LIVPENFIIKTKINVSEFFPGAEPDMGIEFKELDMLRTSKFQGFQGDTEKTSAYFLEVLPLVIVDHDFYRDAAHKYDAKEVADIIGARAELCTYVMQQYLENVLFTRGRKGKGK
jgi:hypothetical protein